MGQNLDSNPHYFEYGTLQPYLIGIALAPYYVYLKIFQSELIEELKQLDYTYQAYYSAPSAFRNNIFFIGRLVTVVMSILVILTTYFIGKNYSVKTGLIAALFLALTMGFANEAHYANLNIPMLFWLTLSILFCMYTLKRPAWKNYLLAGLFGGLAFSTKYSAIYIAIPILIAGFLAEKKILNKKLVCSFLFFILGFLIGTPYAILEFQTFKDDFIFGITARETWKGFIGQRGWIENIPNAINLFGFPLFVFSVIGVIYVLYRLSKERKDLLKNNFIKYDLFLTSWVLIFYFLIGFWQINFMRYLLPIAPAILVLNARFFMSMFKTKLKKILILAFFLVVIYSFVYVVMMDWMIISDSRFTANAWIKENIPKSAVIDIDSDSMQRYPTNLSEYNIRHLDEITVLNDTEFMGFINTYNESEYFILSEFIYYRYFKFSESFPEKTEYYQKLLSNETDYKIMKTFGDKPWYYPKPQEINPRIVVLKKV